MTAATTSLDLLWQLLKIDSPSGDEGPMADWLLAHLGRAHPECRWERLGDSVLVVRGQKPSVAVLAHIDTTGFTLGHRKQMISIGGPASGGRAPVRPVGEAAGHHHVVPHKEEGLRLTGAGAVTPGSRWVYAAAAVQEDDEIVAPYLDNRGGVWAALQVLARSESVAVAFTAGEEMSGSGALVCARRLYEGYGITQALISDLTWDTADVHCGRGVAVSLRDRMVPRQRFLDRVLTLADASGLPYQREVEDSGGSDGMYLLRSGFPIDWVFVGAPEKKPHSPQERVNVHDLFSMAEMLTYLVDGLSL